MKKLLTALLLTCVNLIFCQTLEINKEYKNQAFTGQENLEYAINLEKGKTYLISVYQNNIDVKISLLDAKNNEISSTDLADGNQGYDKLNFSPETTQRYKIVISPFKKGNVPNGEINIFIKKYSTKELEGIKKSSLAAKEENNKDIMTLDIKHFWEAFDQLKDCRNFKDSVQIIQTVYLDRATDGLKNFQKVKDFSAEKFVHKIHQYKKFYNSVRKNTYVANELDISGHSLLDRFKKIYPEAKGFKVCFIIGPVSDGATISGNYLLLGTELLSGDANSDTSEFTNANFKADFSKIKTTDDLKLKLEEVAAHESVHTQQQPRNKDAVICNLLDLAIREGVVYELIHVLQLLPVLVSNRQ